MRTYYIRIDLKYNSHRTLSASCAVECLTVFAAFIKFYRVLCGRRVRNKYVNLVRSNVESSFIHATMKVIWIINFFLQSKRFKCQMSNFVVTIRSKVLAGKIYQKLMFNVHSLALRTCDRRRITFLILNKWKKEKSAKVPWSRQQCILILTASNFKRYENTLHASRGPSGKRTESAKENLACAPNGP